MGLEVRAFKVVVAGNTNLVVTLGEPKANLRKQESDFKKQTKS